MNNKIIPTLRGKEAEEFIKKAEEAAKAPKKDFSKELLLCQEILKKYEKRRNNNIS